MRISRQRRSVAGRTIRAVAPASPRRELYLPRTSFLPVSRLRLDQARPSWIFPSRLGLFNSRIAVALLRVSASTNHDDNDEFFDDSKAMLDYVTLTTRRCIARNKKRC